MSRSLSGFDLFSQVKYYSSEDYEVRCFEEAILKYQVSMCCWDQRPANTQLW